MDQPVKNNHECRRNQQCFSTCICNGTRSVQKFTFGCAVELIRVADDGQCRWMGHLFQGVQELSSFYHQHCQEDQQAGRQERSYPGSSRYKDRHDAHLALFRNRLVDWIRSRINQSPFWRHLSRNAFPILSKGARIRTRRVAGVGFLECAWCRCWSPYRMIDSQANANASKRWDSRRRNGGITVE